MFDFSVLGDRELSRKLRRLDEKIQKKITRQALRKSAKRAKGRIVDNLNSGTPAIVTGDTAQAFKDAKIKGTTRKGRIRIGVTWPERDALGITPDDPNYYPVALEYGHVAGSRPAAPPFPFLRPAIDEHTQSEYGRIAADLRTGIYKEAAKK